MNNDKKAKNFEDELRCVIENHSTIECDEDDYDCVFSGLIDNVRTFEEDRILTNNRGLTVYYIDGSTVVITIQAYRR